MALVSRQSEGGDDAGGAGANLPTLLGPDSAGGSGAPVGGDDEKDGKRSGAAPEDSETPLAKPDRRRSGIPPAVDYRKIQGERPTKTKHSFFTIYKNGQGYWTRIGTVAGVAVMLVYSIYFLYHELGPWLVWNTPTGNIAGGPDDPFLVGVTAGIIALMAAYALGAGTGLAMILGLAGGVAADILCVKGVLGNSASPNKSVILGFIAVYTVAFLVLAYRLMNRPSNVDFLIATDSEMKKVNWTTRAELIGSTKVVILFVILTAIFLFLVDLFFSYLFQMMHVLKVGMFG